MPKRKSPVGAADPDDEEEELSPQPPSKKSKTPSSKSTKNKANTPDAMEQDAMPSAGSKRSRNTNAPPAESDDDSDDEDEPHAQFLGRELLTSHVSALKYESSFFGCYWRNRNNNVCGFPCVGSVSGNMDYQTWQHQQKVRVVAVASGWWWWWCFFLVGVEECIATDPIVCFVLLFVQCISSRMLPMQHPETMMRYAF